MSLRHYLALGVIAAVVTLLVTPLVRRWSLRHGFVAQPGGRKIHAKPVSQLGGIAIFAGVVVALAVQAIGEVHLGWGGSLTVPLDGRVNLLGVFAGLSCMFLVGVVDDVTELTPGVKLVGQMLAAGLVVWAGLRIDFIGDPVRGGLLMLGLLSIPVTVLYLVGFANVINLIDGLDGLAAGVTAIAALSLAVLAAQANRFDAATLAVAVIGACIGFLRYNFNPASIFMGDSGAMFLGFTLAVVSLLGVMKTTAAIALAVPLLIIGVPIFDTASAIVRRVKHRRPIQEADRGHIHHRLLRRGFNQRQTVVIIYVWSAALAVGGYAVRYAPSVVKLIALGVLFAITAFMAYWLGLYEAAHHGTGDDPEE